MKQLVVGSFILVLVTLGWDTLAVGEQRPVPQGELRIVDKNPANWGWIVWNVMEHLIDFDRDGALVPRLATSWYWLDAHTLEMTLRQGVRFHNDEVFDAEIVKLNWEEILRFKQPHGFGVVFNFQPGARLEIVDPYTVRFVFPEPDGGVLAKLSSMHIGNRQFYRDVGWREKHW
jgi:ABC-type transport system substrate-binding protein